MSDSDRTLSDILSPRGSYTKSVKPEVEEPRQDPEDEYQAFSHGRVGHRPQMMIVFQRCSGQVEVFAYSRLTQIRSENPNLGFTLVFGDKEVTVEGQQLATLFHYICEHRAAEVIEADRASLMTGDDQCVVSGIRSDKLK